MTPMLTHFVGFKHPSNKIEYSEKIKNFADWRPKQNIFEPYGVMEFGLSLIRPGSLFTVLSSPVTVPHSS